MSRKLLLLSVVSLWDWLLGHPSLTNTKTQCNALIFARRFRVFVSCIATAFFSSSALADIPESSFRSGDWTIRARVLGIAASTTLSSSLRAFYRLGWTSYICTTCEMKPQGPNLALRKWLSLSCHGIAPHLGLLLSERPWWITMFFKAIESVPFQVVHRLVYLEQFRLWATTTSFIARICGNELTLTRRFRLEFRSTRL
jgi:hypothetical protein